MELSVLWVQHPIPPTLRPPAWMVVVGCQHHFSVWEVELVSIPRLRCVVPATTPCLLWTVRAHPYRWNAEQRGAASIRQPTPTRSNRSRRREKSPTHYRAVRVTNTRR